MTSALRITHPTKLKKDAKIIRQIFFNLLDLLVLFFINEKVPIPVEVIVNFRGNSTTFFFF